MVDQAPKSPKNPKESQKKTEDMEAKLTLVKNLLNNPEGFPIEKIEEEKYLANIKTKLEEARNWLKTKKLQSAVLYIGIGVGNPDHTIYKVPKTHPNFSGLDSILKSQYKPAFMRQIEKTEQNKAEMERKGIIYLYCNAEQDKYQTSEEEPGNILTTYASGFPLGKDTEKKEVIQLINEITGERGMTVVLDAITDIQFCYPKIIAAQSSFKLNSQSVYLHNCANVTSNTIADALYFDAAGKQGIVRKGILNLLADETLPSEE